MMDEPKKSDFPIVARRPANKTGQPVAEPTEPRGEAERNADQQITQRTQSRASVSSALDRVRQAAKAVGNAASRRCSITLTLLDYGRPISVLSEMRLPAWTA